MTHHLPLSVRVPVCVCVEVSQSCEDVWGRTLSSSSTQALTFYLQVGGAAELKHRRRRRRRREDNRKERRSYWGCMFAGLHVMRGGIETRREREPDHKYGSASGEISV